MKTREAIELAARALREPDGGLTYASNLEAADQLERILTAQFPYLDVGGRDIVKETDPEPTLDLYIDAVLKGGPCG